MGREKNLIQKMFFSSPVYKIIVKMFREVLNTKKMVTQLTVDLHIPIGLKKLRVLRILLRKLM